MAKILVVEDDKSISKLLKYNFEQEGYTVFLAYDGEMGLRLARLHCPDLVVLDWMLPALDGLEVCKELRKSGSVAIIMLTAKKEETDRVLGLEFGADDYVAKPFSLRELLARVKSVLRRAAVKSEVSSVFQVGKLTLDWERYEVKLDQKILDLSSKEFSFLKTLVKANGRVLSREQLLEIIWGYDRASDIDTRTVDQHVARLRAKLGKESKRILTVKNVGYKFKSEE